MSQLGNIQITDDMVAFQASGPTLFPNNRGGRFQYWLSDVNSGAVGNLQFQCDWIYRFNPFLEVPNPILVNNSLTFNRATRISGTTAESIGPLGTSRQSFLTNTRGFIGLNQDPRVNFAPAPSFRNETGLRSGIVMFALTEGSSPDMTSGDSYEISLGYGIQGSNPDAYFVIANNRSDLSAQGWMGISFGETVADDSVQAIDQYKMFCLAGPTLGSQYMWINNYENSGVDWGSSLGFPPDFAMFTGFTDWPTPLRFSPTGENFPQAAAISSFKNYAFNTTNEGRIFWKFVNSVSQQLFGSLFSSGRDNDGRPILNLGLPSDYRLKNDLQSLDQARAQLELIEPKRFTWINTNDDDIGFLAHEVAKIIPYAVAGEHDAVDDQGQPQYQYLNPNAMIPLLTAAIQELDRDLLDLESQISRI